VVKELIARGLKRVELVRAVQDLTGYSEPDAQQLIGIETGTWKGDSFASEPAAHASRSCS
jgi:hypothetical protein